jgi:hypothetical protein
MKAKEIINFTNEEAIFEGGKSGGTRYNTEVGLLVGFMAIDPEQFDPNYPEKTMKENLLRDPKKVYADIKSLLAPNFDRPRFIEWARKAPIYQKLMAPKISAKKTRVEKYGWAGGTNLSSDGPADVAFVGCDIYGVSVKAEGGITLGNLTVKHLGLDPEKGNDIFYHYAQNEFVQMKMSIFTDVLDAAIAKPNQVLSFRDPKYTIIFDSATKKFTCTGKKVFSGTKEQILKPEVLQKNSPWQRVFGDWFQLNWQTKKQYAAPLFKKIAEEFERTIQEHLMKSGVATILRFEDRPYFYASDTSLYYVPSKKEAPDLVVKSIKYAAPDGTSQLFSALIGRPDSDDAAEIGVYIRYANGMFEANPTCRIQNLKNPEFISWEKLYPNI